MENELKKYGTILWHWAWLIVLGTLLGAGIAYISSRLTTPVYSASTTLLVNEAPSSGKTADYTSILTSERLARTYSEMMTKKPVLEEALNDLNVDPAAAETLQSRINVNLVRDTQLMVLQVESEDPAVGQESRKRHPDGLQPQECRGADRALCRFQSQPHVRNRHAQRANCGQADRDQCHWHAGWIRQRGGAGAAADRTHSIAPEPGLLAAKLREYSTG